MEVKMKKLFLGLLLIFSMFINFNVQTFCAYAKSPDSPETRVNITAKSALAGVLSFLVWPGIGQAVNDQRSGKVITHAALGFLPPYRFWSGYDAIVDRQGGYWKCRI